VLSSQTTLKHLPGYGERSAIAVSPLPLLLIGEGQLVALSGRQFGGFKQGPLNALIAPPGKRHERSMPVRLTPNSQNSPGGP
jgi:hypothetical protein